MVRMRNARGQAAVGFIFVILGVAAAATGAATLMGGAVHNSLTTSGSVAYQTRKSVETSDGIPETVVQTETVTTQVLGAITISDHNTYQQVDTYQKQVQNTYSEPGNKLVSSQVLSSTLVSTKNVLITAVSTTVVTKDSTLVVSQSTTEGEIVGGYLDTYAVTTPVTETIQETDQVTTTTTYDPETGAQTGSSTSTTVLSSGIVSSTPGTPTKTLISQIAAPPAYQAWALNASVATAQFPASAAFDGNTTSEWASDWNTQWIEAQLATPGPITYLNMLPQIPWPGTDTMDLTVYGSTDGSTWTSLQSWTNVPVTGGQWIQMVLTPPMTKSYGYVKIEGSFAGSTFDWYEIQIH